MWQECAHGRITHNYTCAFPKRFLFVVPKLPKFIASSVRDLFVIGNVHCRLGPPMSKFPIEKKEASARLKRKKQGNSKKGNTIKELKERERERERGREGGKGEIERERERDRERERERDIEREREREGRGGRGTG